MKSLFPFFLFIFLISCGPRSLDDFQEEGEGVIRSLVQELKSIHKRDQLLAACPKLQRYFDRLAMIMIEAEEYQKKHGEKENGQNQLNHELSDQLRVELNRIYEIEGGRQIMEKCQEKGLHLLYHKFPQTG